MDGIQNGRRGIIRSSESGSDDGRLPRLILSHPPSFSSTIPFLLSVPSLPRSPVSSSPTSSCPMPARTLPTSPDPSLSPPRFYARPTPYSLPSSHPHRDTNDDRLESNFHVTAMLPPNARPDQDYTAQSGWSPPQPRIYPDPSSIPPHWQIHPATLAQLRDGRAYVAPGPPLSGNPRGPWQNPYTRTIQVQPFVAPPPPPIPHKVWILDCKGCGTFLTNRGMKVSESFRLTLICMLCPIPAWTIRASPVRGSILASIKRSLVCVCNLERRCMRCSASLPVIGNVGGVLWYTTLIPLHIYSHAHTVDSQVRRGYMHGKGGPSLATAFLPIAAATNETDELPSQAVLLLRPNVPLYSTDALPINCSAFSAELEDPAHGSSASMSSATSAGPSNSARSSTSPPTADLSQPSSSSAERPPTRTCECLTQTLCCHGCGSAVGYMIVTPCQRCTSSITVNNRATNGHRFVFYSSEITACERHYVLGERGVSRYHPPAPAAPPAHVIQAGMAGLSINTTPVRPPPAQQSTPSPSSPTSPSTPASMPPLSPGPAIPGRRISIDYLPTPPPEVDSPFAPGARPVFGFNPSVSTSVRRTSLSTATVPSSIPSQSRPALVADTSRAVPPVPPNSHSTSPYSGSNPNPAAQTSSPTPPSPSRARAASVSAASSMSASLSLGLHGYTVNGSTVYLQRPLHFLTPAPPIQPPPAPAPEPLKPGEQLYWHHLLRSGEIPAVSEDPRARVSRDEGAKDGDSGRRNALPSGIVAGR